MPLKAINCKLKRMPETARAKGGRGREEWRLYGCDMGVCWVMVGGGGGWAIGRWGTGDWGRVFIARRRWRRRSHACQQINHARNAIKYKKIIQSSPPKKQHTTKQQTTATTTNIHKHTHTHTHLRTHICTKINARKPPTQKSCPQGVCVML